jgi:hypothetical protein
MSDFKPGEKIRAVRDTTSLYDKYFPKGTVLTYHSGDVYRQYPGRVNADMANTSGGFLSVLAEDFEAVETGPKWSDIEVGDKVTFRDKTTDL